MEALRLAVGRSERLDGGAGDVVEGVLRGEAPARGLAVGAERHGLGRLGAEVVEQAGPEEACGTELGHLHEVVHADGEEEGEAGREGIDVEACSHACLHILHAVGEGVGELDVGRRTGLLHVVAGDGDAVEAGHLARGVGEDVCDDPHRGAGRIDVGVPHHELFEDVVLDGACELVAADALLLCGDDVEGEDGEDRAVHGHGDAHLVERDAVEEDAHVEDGVDGDAGHADITDHGRVVGVVAPVGGEVEGDGEALLAGGEVAAVEGVGGLGGGEAGILAHGPGLRRIHAGVGAAEEGSEAWHGVDGVEAVAELGRVGGRDVDAFGRGEASGELGAARGGPEFAGGEVGEAAHGVSEGSCAASCRSGARPVARLRKSVRPAALSSAAASPGLPAA